jgi:hypothetical protein
LKRALAECGCDHLLGIDPEEPPLSWLTRYREPLRRELGLPATPHSSMIPAPCPAVSQDVEQMIAWSKKLVKQSEGWIV